MSSRDTLALQRSLLVKVKTNVEQQVTFIPLACVDHVASNSHSLRSCLIFVHRSTQSMMRTHLASQR